jgi:hypothetical protein
LQKAEFVRRKFSAACEMRLARCKFGAIREASEFSEQIYDSAPNVFTLAAYFCAARFVAALHF